MTDLVIPDEAIETAARAAVEDATTPGAREWNRVAPWTRDIARSQARAALTAAAPLIVAANQPQPNDDLRETLNARLRKGLPSPPPHVGGWALPLDRRAALVDALAPVVEAYVAAQVAAVRADALREAAAEVHRERLWQLEIQTRGLTHLNNNPVERFGVVEEILTDRAEAGRG